MKSIKQWYKDFINNMAKANEDSFGDKKLDCCGMNSKKQKKSTNDKQQK